MAKLCAATSASQTLRIRNYDGDLCGGAYENQPQTPRNRLSIPNQPNRRIQPHQKQLRLPDFEPLAKEAQAVNQVKKSKRFTILLGNPPYAVGSANTCPWITKQVKDNYYPQDEIKERNTKVISDDYVKYIRFSQYTLSLTCIGILGYITNHAWIDNPTFRRMRQSMLSTFSNLCLLDLHGNTRKKEKAPDGSKDQNVFDIMQGVAITIAYKQPSAKPSQAFHADLYGTRQTKYNALERESFFRPHHSTCSSIKTIHYDPNTIKAGKL